MKKYDIIVILLILLPFAVAFEYNNPTLPKLNREVTATVSGSSSSGSSSGGGNPFNQILNTTSTVTFNHLNLPNRSYSNISDFLFQPAGNYIYSEGSHYLPWNRTSSNTFWNVTNEYGYFTGQSKNFTISKTGMWEFSVDICAGHSTGGDTGNPTVLTAYITRNSSINTIFGGYFNINAAPAYGITETCTHMQGFRRLNAGENVQVYIVYSDLGAGGSVTIYQAGTQFRGRYLYT